MKRFPRSGLRGLQAGGRVGRWLQFSVRTLLVFVTLSAVACTWFVVKLQQARRQREAVKAIVEAGGSVVYDYEVTLGNGVPVAPSAPRPKPPGPAWVRKLLGDDFFAKVVVARIQNDAGLEHVRELTDLEELDLGGTQVTDAGLQHLRKLTRLGRLDLEGTQVTDAGLAHVNGLFSLRRLVLAETGVTITMRSSIIWA